MTDKAVPLIPQIGERALVVGQTGSGKTALSAWLLRRVTQAPTIILDTKEEEKFRALKPSRFVESVPDMLEAAMDEAVDYVVFRPPLEVTMLPEALDAILLAIYNELRGVAVYVDEAFMVHKNGQAGPGLLGLLTRGRSRGITTILAAQRPAWLSRFCVTEAQRFYLCRLTDDDDKRRLGDVIPGFRDLANPPKFGFWYFEQGAEAPLQFGPVKLDSGLNLGYTDPLNDTGPEGESASSPNPRPSIWL
jgi:energy-coupling factor transporter ATP-binding protein EcfA2